MECKTIRNKIEDNNSQFFDVRYNQFNLGFDNELPILGKHKMYDSRFKDTTYHITILGEMKQWCI